MLFDYENRRFAQFLRLGRSSMGKTAQAIIIVLLSAILGVQVLILWQTSRQNELVLPSHECRQARTEMLNLIQSSNEQIGQIKGILAQAPALSSEATISIYQAAQLEMLSQLAANNIKVYKIFSVCP
jgi:hypothetical protein